MQNHLTSKADINPKPHVAKLQTRIFMTFLFLAALLLFGFSVFFYHYVSQILIQRESSALQDLTSSFQSQCDAVVQGMDSVSININYNRTLKDLIGNRDIDLSDVLLSEYSSICSSLSSVESTAVQINLFDYHGNVLESGRWACSGQYKAEDNLWIEETKVHGGTKLLSEPFLPSFYSNPSGYVTSFIPYVALRRAYLNMYGTPVAATEVLEPCKSIFKSIRSYKASNPNSPEVYVYNRDGKMIYPYASGSTTVQKPALDYFSVCSGQTGSASVRNSAAKTEEVVISAASTYTGWVYVVVQSQKNILEPVNALVRLLLGVIICFLAVSVAAAVVLSRSLMRPIKALSEEMRHTDIDNLNTPSPTLGRSEYAEIQELSDTFQAMRRHLKVSMDELIETRQQEQKSRSMALQSQINPHFYYNSLASVIVLAENSRTEEVVRMCRNLTKIMRYITDGSSLTVTVEEELNYLQEYLYCMKVRYQSSLNYQIDVEAPIRSQKIPRLLIQPLVENSLKYGMNSEPPWNITIRGRMVGNGWLLEVLDTGSGFTSEALVALQQKIAEADQSSGMPGNLHIDGMGLLNVYLRWKLYSGERAQFLFGNTAQGHGRVAFGLTAHGAGEKSGQDAE